ncbi:hypothetical protein JB92DRAFT_2821400 [Gautieria morchelliformis]|nr:hypothetical protein JB92DRAFT_2821400 [Gautieria morchelliformis]
MSSQFAFMPRSVARGTTQKSLKHRVLSKPAAHVEQGSEPGPSTAHQRLTPGGTQADSERNAQLRDDERLILIEAAMSDYSVWCNPELQREMKSGQDGYMPLKLVLSQSTLLVTLHPYPSEADIMRCIRASPRSLLETRMLITEPSRSEWFNRGPVASTSYQSGSGGFEVRRKDWKALLRALAESGWNKEWWDQRTVYIERLPIVYRSVQGVARYIQSLLVHRDEDHPTASGKIQIQSVMFPPNHLAPQDKPSRCKGFAFVVLESPALIDMLCRSYPWDGFGYAPSADKEAVKFGLRVLPKTSWERMKVEYLAYQQLLLSQVAEKAAEPQVEVEKRKAYSESDCNSQAKSPPPEIQMQPSWFPQDCLVFVRNIHPDTNKTTLRTLFSASLASSKGGVDYVDFTKGIDTCHLRLASPSDVARLVSHFTAQHTAQHDALDQAGSAPTGERPKIELEIVRGTREELYWEKIPEKVRNAAVARLYSAVKDHCQTAGTEKEGGRQRKRQKKV